MPARSRESPAARELFKSLEVIPDMLFDPNVTERIMQIFEDNGKHPYGSDNILELSPYLSALVDAGYVALRPLTLTKHTISAPHDYIPAGSSKWKIHFSVHWMQQTRMHPNFYLGSAYGAGGIRMMLDPSREYSTFGSGLCEIDAKTGEQITEGHECFVTRHTQKDAEDMFVMLALRWSVNMALCLSGGIGLDETNVGTEWGLDSEDEHERAMMD